MYEIVKSYDTKERLLKYIYLDNAATMPINDSVLNKMIEYAKYYGNPSSIHQAGREARKLLDKSRAVIAGILGANTNEIYFSSGGTESANWALVGAAFANADKGKHIITSPIEHHAVINTCENLKKHGYEITYIPVDKYGKVDIDAIKKAIKKDTILISIMYANNEVGTLQPVYEIAKIASEHGVLFHTDAVQAVSNVPINLGELGADMLSLSAHKFAGPKGVGALYIKKGTKISPFIYGGEQERGRRAGTENVLGAVGMAEALKIACTDIMGSGANIASKRDRLINGIIDSIDGAQLNGHPTMRLPGNVNISFKNTLAQSLLMRLDSAGIAASAGSACASGSPEVSHVLLSMGVPREKAKGSIRLTLSCNTTNEDIDYVLGVMPTIVKECRSSAI